MTPLPDLNKNAKVHVLLPSPFAAGFVVAL